MKGANSEMSMREALETKMNFWEFLVNYSGLLSLVIVFAIIIFKTWILEWVKKGVGHGYSKDLESFKSQLTKEREIEIEDLRREFKKRQEIQTLATASYMVGQHSLFEKKINSIQELWGIIVKSKSLMPSIFIAADHLSEDEYLKMISLEDIKPHLKLFDTKSILTLIEHLDSGETLRPFVGEYLWSLYRSYIIFTKSILLQIHKGIQTGEIKYWEKDQQLISIIDNVLTKDDIEYVKKFKFGRMEVIQSKIEDKIIEHSKKIISGDISADEGLVKAKEILKAISKFSIEDKELRIKTENL